MKLVIAMFGVGFWNLFVGIKMGRQWEREDREIKEIEARIALLESLRESE